jgi:hypothetical protein
MAEPNSQIAHPLWAKVLVIILLVGAGVFEIGNWYKNRKIEGNNIGKYESQALASIINQARDPNSVDFRKLSTKSVKNGYVTCGEVNMANAFGGMTGFQRFLSSANGNFIMIEYVGESRLDVGGATAFEVAWKEFC